MADPSIASRDTTEHSLALVDAAFRSGAEVAEARPTRFLLNLTERCQLRCVHCITDAPRRTEEGTARSMSAEVLAALEPHFAHAQYVGLTHAGEPMLSPVFAEALTAVQRARAGEPTVVHLLTNGLALTDRRLDEALALGVRSLSFSLDGMRAGSNDVVRIGSRATDLLERIRHVAARRHAESLDLRLGISCTLTRVNAAESAELVRFAVDAGLDWVKLEELYPQNDAASALLPTPPEVLAAVGRARAAAAGSRLVVADHTQPLTAFKCQLVHDKRARRFAEADDFVNRTDINACRHPYEQACVEPDGTVKPVTFHHPPAGNVLEGDLLALWNGPVLREVRAAQRAARPCGAGPTTCPADPGPRAW